ncbi:hypothetical protein ABMA27_010758 [Loxostege sticticalis]|uniref:Uncharacterized protein n=1 Tax=Loxostege sticticalis TaxID=481309 RepID=A0ABR3H4D6_LOXSC
MLPRVRESVIVCVRGRSVDTGSRAPGAPRPRARSSASRSRSASSSSSSEEEPPPKSIESIHGTETFPPVSSLPDAQVSANQRLDDKTRHQPSLLPFAHRGRASYILTRLAAGSWSLKQAQRLLGYFNFATFITHRGRLHCRTLQRHARQLQKQPRRFELFTEEVRLELEWWLENVSQKSPIHRESLPINYVVTDASDVRWGALLNNDMIQGTWTRRQRNCNLKEMYAVIAAISSKAQTLNNSSIVLQSDNRTVVSYIKKRRRNEVSKASRDDQATSGTDRQPKRRTSPSPPAGTVQYGSRPPLAQSRRLRVAPSERGDGEGIQPLGDPRQISRVQRGSHRIELCYARLVRLERLLSRRFQQMLEIRSRASTIIVAPKWTKPFWRPDLKSRALARPVKMKNLTKTLIDTAPGRPPAQVHNVQFEAWLISAGTL